MNTQSKTTSSGEKAPENSPIKINPAVLASCVTAVVFIAVIAAVLNHFADKEAPGEIRFSIRETSASGEETKLRSETAARSKTISKTKTKAATTSKPETTTKKTVSSAVQTIRTSAAETVPQYTFPADINLVSKEQLMCIDGIGEKTAERIVSYRISMGKIRNMSTLLEIEGIGEKTLAKLEGYLYVSAADYSEISVSAPAAQTTTAALTTASSSSASASEATTTAAKTSQTEAAATVSTAEAIPAIAEMSRVNINTATVEELTERLLLDEETANKIVELRNNIQYFSNDLELLYVDGFSESMLVERRPFIVLED